MDCDDLAASYAQIIADSEHQIQDSKDRQHAIKVDAFSIKGEEGQSFEDFAAGLKDGFDTYVPIPIDPEVDYVPAPSTCQESTFEAFAELEAFIGELSIEMTYEQWLAGELEDCCDDLES
jgi:hypothetical protein